jgi:hypothetical protein
VLCARGALTCSAGISAIAKKYLGGGFGGYALYLFDSASKRDAFVATDTKTRKCVEPYLQN